MFASLDLDNGLNKLRSTVALSFPVTKKLDIACAYRMEHEFYVNNAENLYILEGKILYNL